MNYAGKNTNKKNTNKKEYESCQRHAKPRIEMLGNKSVSYLHIGMSWHMC